MPSEKIPTFTLARTGAAIPALAFGSGSKHRIKKWGNAEKSGDALDMEIVEVLSNAIKAGFTHLDCAETYTTRGELAMAVQKSGLAREHFWITDKFDQGWPHYDARSRSPSGPRESILKGLEIFKMDYYDLFLIHGQFFREDLVDVTIIEAWKQLEQCYEEGLVKNIGVSNFDVQNLEKIMDIAKYKPQVNQIEYNLYLQDQTEGITEYCRKNDIQLEGFCPLTPILDSRINDENHPLKPVIKEMAKKYKVEPSIIVLRWVYQSGVIPITTSSNFERMKQSFQIFDFELSNEDFETLKKIGQTYKVRTYFTQFFK